MKDKRFINKLIGGYNMGCVIKNLVEYSGIADEFPECPKAFTELSVEDNLIIPEQKPNVEQIFKIISEVKILQKRLVKTPIGEGASGTIATGYKLIIEAVLSQKVLYVADRPCQPVHAAEFEKIFSTFVIIPPIHQCYNKDLIECFCVEPFIEDIYANLIDKRTIYENATIFINVSSPLFCKVHNNKPCLDHKDSYRSMDDLKETLMNML
jgi:spore morphogenesis protein SipL